MARSPVPPHSRTARFLEILADIDAVDARCLQTAFAVSQEGDVA